MTEFQLTREILQRSESKIWSIAKQEWYLKDVYEAEEPETCLCGHSPIIEICVIKNRLNGNIVAVGNCCVKKFIGLNSDKIFESVKKVRRNVEKSLNSDAIEHAFKKGWINKWEHEFSMDTMRKRKLSVAQLHKRLEVNRKMLNNMKKSNSLQ